MPASYNPTLSGPANGAAVPTGYTSVRELWRKVQGPLRIAANFLFPEWDALAEFKNFDVDWSTREITAPFDLMEDVGVASIPEGGYEARPSSPTVVDGSFTWILLNKRITLTKTAKWIHQKSKGAMIAEQFKFQGRKALEAIGRRVKDYWWASSSGVMATVASVASGAGTATQTLNLTNGYAQTDITSASFIAGLFRAGEWVALIRAGALVANAIGQISAVAVAANAQITVTFNGAVTAAAADQLVFANSLENATIDGTDYNKAMTGFMDALKSTSLQGISGTTYPNWNVGYSAIDAVRFTNIRFRKMKQGVENRGGGKMNKVWWSQGVENDVFDQMQAGVRFTDVFNLELDGSPKAKGVTLTSARSVPPGYVVGMDSSAVAKMVLLPKPGQPTWDDGEKTPDRSMFVFPMDYPCQMVWLNRGNLAYETGKTEL